MKFFKIILVLTVLTSCNQADKTEMIERMVSLEKNKDFKTSDSLINTYLEFCKLYPEDENVVKYQFKAAEILVKQNKAVQGARLYETIGTAYDDKELSPEALIRAAICLESVPDKANALRIYELFVKKYPNHERIAEIKANMEVIGLTDEQLIERFKALENQ